MKHNRNQTVGIIGGGNMGEALIKGLYKTTSVNVVEANVQRALYLKKTYRVDSVDTKTLLTTSAVIILAVKPQDMLTALTAINEHKNRDVSLFISIAAGLTTKFFEEHLSGKPRIIRAMPNMPALIGEGITGLCGGRFAKPADMKLAQGLLASIGQTVIVKESMIDAVTAVSGSGPAYVFMFVEQWMAAAKQLGFKEAEAKQLVYQTLVGSAHLLAQSDLTAGVLREKVTSKGGTTAAALDVINKAKFDKTFSTALKAAAQRAKQLAK